MMDGLLEQISQFAEKKRLGAILSLPATLSPDDRKQLRVFVEENFSATLKAESYGVGAERTIHVLRKQDVDTGREAGAGGGSSPNTASPAPPGGGADQQTYNPTDTASLEIRTSPTVELRRAKLQEAVLLDDEQTLQTSTIQSDSKLQMSLPSSPIAMERQLNLMNRSGWNSKVTIKNTFIHINEITNVMLSMSGNKSSSSASSPKGADGGGSTSQNGAPGGAISPADPVDVSKSMPAGLFLQKCNEEKKKRIWLSTRGRSGSSVKDGATPKSTKSYRVKRSDSELTTGEMRNPPSEFFQTWDGFDSGVGVMRLNTKIGVPELDISPGSFDRTDTNDLNPAAQEFVPPDRTNSQDTAAGAASLPQQPVVQPPPVVVPLLKNEFLIGQIVELQNVISPYNGLKGVVCNIVYDNLTTGLQNPAGCLSYDVVVLSKGNGDSSSSVLRVGPQEVIAGPPGLEGVVEQQQSTSATGGAVGHGADWSTGNTATAAANNYDGVGSHAAQQNVAEDPYTAADSFPDWQQPSAIPDFVPASDPWPNITIPQHQLRAIAEPFVPKSFAANENDLSIPPPGLGLPLAQQHSSTSAHGGGGSNWNTNFNNHFYNQQRAMSSSSSGGPPGYNINNHHGANWSYNNGNNFVYHRPRPIMLNLQNLIPENGVEVVLWKDFEDLHAAFHNGNSAGAGTNPNGSPGGGSSSPDMKRIRQELRARGFLWAAPNTNNNSKSPSAYGGPRDSKDSVRSGGTRGMNGNGGGDVYAAFNVMGSKS
ncbi:unnamed protein product [Amoebophrya sp. A120]|nr:unnamed protein product [Amoebophrya sp. A120]|eukprot:GSA120T00019828001.1